MIKALDLWLPGYLASRPPASSQMTDLMFCVCDHFEPLHDTDREGALRRLQNWNDRFPRVAASAVDADGFSPKHTFFYPVEQYAPDLLQPLERLCSRYGCEVEVHLHHHNDTEENLRRQLSEGVANLRRHGFLSSGPSHEPVFGFIHGNWALDNSHPEGNHCGVNGELAILKSLGCYGDFTMPSAPDRCQTRRVNSLYYADHRGSVKSHDDGIPVRAEGAGGASTAPLRLAEDHLLLVQGPLALNWKWRKWKILPRIENADLTGGNPPTANRLDLWLKVSPHVIGRPEWRFVKLHTHGAVERNSRVLLGDAFGEFHQQLVRTANRRGFRLHYVTARELANILHAAEDGHGGNAGDYRDYLYPRPPVSNEFSARKA